MLKSFTKLLMSHEFPEKKMSSQDINNHDSEDKQSFGLMLEMKQRGVTKCH
jgi:hypothetical protein